MADKLFVISLSETNIFYLEIIQAQIIKEVAIGLYITFDWGKEIA
ncbi:hypothetical protein [Methylobacter svalbardensis]